MTVLAGRRAFSLVAFGDPAPSEDGHETEVHRLPRAMMWPLWVLAVPTVGLGLVLLSPPDILHGVHVSWLTAFTGTLVSLAGVGWSLTVTRIGGKDVADALPPGVRAFLRDGYRLDDVQDALVVRALPGPGRAWLTPGTRTSSTSTRAVASPSPDGRA